jgi:hypothetical protein
VTTPNPAPDERANGWRDDHPSLSTEFSPAHHGTPAARAQFPAEPSSDPAASDDPGASPAIGRAYIPAPPFPGSEWAVSLREALAALGIAVVLALAGFPLGWLWSSIAPHVPVQITSDGAVLSQPEQEQLIGGEGTYLFITVGVGLVAAILAWALLRRYRGYLMLLGLALGGAVGGAITAWFGHRIGLSHFRDLLAHAPVGTNFLAPVSLRVGQFGWWHHALPYARGDVLAMAITALVIYLLLVTFSSYASLREPDAPSFAVVDGNGYGGAGYPVPVPGEIEPPVN